MPLGTLLNRFDILIYNTDLVVNIFLHYLGPHPHFLTRVQ